MTYFKVCPGCKNRCYSASWQGNWTCPHCEKDLEEVEPRSISELKEESGEASEKSRS